MKIMMNDQMLQQSTISAGDLITQHSNLVNSFRGSKYLPKINHIRFSYEYIFEYEHLKSFI